MIDTESDGNESHQTNFQSDDECDKKFMYWRNLIRIALWLDLNLIIYYRFRALILIKDIFWVYHKNINYLHLSVNEQIPNNTTRFLYKFIDFYLKVILNEIIIDRLSWAYCDLLSNGRQTAKERWFNVDDVIRLGQMEDIWLIKEFILYVKPIVCSKIEWKNQ